VGEDPLTLRVDLGLGADAGADEVDSATADLLRELRELDVESVERPSGGPPPEGSRAVELAALGALVVKLGGAAVGPLAHVLQSWLARRSGRTIKLTLGADSLEISGGSAQYQRELIEMFLAARTAG
jgi:Effector Associated Constant Component 1